ncbi:PAS domain S-box protein [Halomicroarcula sp. GCM10025709]|uniref:PAS domain S-box protein n=1 Tax=Haloarcula TaxID=2237 RepID=UPI0024C44884|nr:PAS domain S-box protein [Halomicroarcula sp. YJ-61-S]
MDDGSSAVIDVCYVDLRPSVASAVEPPFGSDRIERSTAVDADRALAALADGAVDCLVVVCRAVDDGSLALVEAASSTAPEVPRLVVTNGAAGLSDAALDAGATDCVVAEGADLRALLPHRIRSAVEDGQVARETRADAARFESLTQNTSFAVVTIDEESTVQYASEAVDDLFGYAPAELVGESLTAIMPERFHDAHHAAVSEYLTTGERALAWDWIELPGCHRDGTEIPLGVSFGERDAPDGHRFTAVIRDISEQRDRVERLDRLATAMEESMDGVALLNEDGEYVSVNEAHADIYGCDADDLVGEHWSMLYDEDETERFRDEIMPVVEREGEWRGEAQGRRADGSPFPQELSLTRLDEDALVCIVRDITDRVQRRRELESERQFVRTVIDTLQDVFYVLDTDGCFTEWNDRMAEVTGYTDEELDGMPALNVIPPEDREHIAENIHAVVSEDADRTPRSALLTKQGDRIPYEFTGSQLTDADGEVIGLTGIGRDIAMETLREQRLSVLSRVLRHNVRNRLTVVLAQAEHIVETADSPASREGAERIQRAGSNLQRAAEQAHRAETLLRDRPTKQRVDLVEQVRAGRDHAAADPDSVDLVLPETAPVVATPIVETAVAELLENALTHVSDPTVQIHVSVGEETTRAVVADDGPGLPDHERAALLGESETPLEHGTGLGLWLVNWIVAASGGRVAVPSEGGGTTVELAFPTAE